MVRTTSSMLHHDAKPSESNAMTSRPLDNLRAEQLRRRVSRMEKLGMFDVSESLHVQRVSSFMELKQAYRLVHDTFVHQGYILPDRSQMRLRIYEAVPETAMFVAKAQGRIVGVIGLIFDSPDMGLPSDEVFPEEINALRQQGRKVAEVTNLAVAPDYRATRAFMELSRAILAYSTEHECDDLFISISAGHALFFETVLNFQAWGEERIYDSHTGDKVEGKRLDLHCRYEYLRVLDRLTQGNQSLYDWFITDNPYQVPQAGVDRLARKQFLQPGQLFGLFVKDSDFLIRCGDDDLRILRNRWGAEIFDPIYAAARSLHKSALPDAA